MKRFAMLLSLLPLVALADVVDPSDLCYKFVYHGVFVPLFWASCLSAVGLVLLLALRLDKKQLLTAILVIGVTAFLLLFPVVKCRTCEGHGYKYHCGRIYCRCCDEYGLHSVLRGLFPCRSPSSLELPREEAKKIESLADTVPDNKSTDKSL